jgi:hypothetical protein
MSHCLPHRHSAKHVVVSRTFILPTFCHTIVSLTRRSILALLGLPRPLRLFPHRRILDVPRLHTVASPSRGLWRLVPTLFRKSSAFFFMQTCRNMSSPPFSVFDCMSSSLPHYRRPINVPSPHINISLSFGGDTSRRRVGVRSCVSV